MTWNRANQPSAASANLDGAPHGFRVTGDAAWDSDSTDYAMFSAAGNAAVAAMVKSARAQCRHFTEAQTAARLRREMARIDADQGTYPVLRHLRDRGEERHITGMREVWDTMVRETIAGALDEAWNLAYGHRFEMELFTGPEEGEQP